MDTRIYFRRTKKEYILGVWRVLMQIRKPKTIGARYTFLNNSEKISKGKKNERLRKNIFSTNNRAKLYL